MIGIQTWLAWAIVATLLLVAWGIGTMWQDGSRELRKALIGALVLLAAMIAAWAAFAHDHNRPGLDSWYSALRSGKGPCCGGPKIDATVLIDADWESKDGRYRVRIEGQWYDVPEDAVLSGPNLDGRTLVWPIKGYGGLTIRCFMPGAMT